MTLLLLCCLPGETVRTRSSLYQCPFPASTILCLSVAFWKPTYSSWPPSSSWRNPSQYINMARLCIVCALLLYPPNHLLPDNQTGQVSQTGQLSSSVILRASSKAVWLFLCGVAGTFPSSLPSLLHARHPAFLPFKTHGVGTPTFLARDARLLLLRHRLVCCMGWRWTFASRIVFIPLVKRFRFILWFVGVSARALLFLAGLCCISTSQQ